MRAQPCRLPWPFLVGVQADTLLFLNLQQLIHVRSATYLSLRQGLGLSRLCQSVVGKNLTHAVGEYLAAVLAVLADLRLLQGFSSS